MRKLSERIPNKREDLESAPVPTSPVVQITTSKSVGEKEIFLDTDGYEGMLRVGSTVKRWKNAKRISDSAPREDHNVFVDFVQSGYKQQHTILRRRVDASSAKMVASITNRTSPCTDPSNELIKTWQVLHWTPVKNTRRCSQIKLIAGSVARRIDEGTASTLPQSKKSRERRDLMKSYLYLRNRHKTMVDRKTAYEIRLGAWIIGPLVRSAATKYTKVLCSSWEWHHQFGKKVLDGLFMCHGWTMADDMPKHFEFWIDNPKTYAGVDGSLKVFNTSPYSSVAAESRRGWGRRSGRSWLGICFEHDCRSCSRRHGDRKMCVQTVRVCVSERVRFVLRHGCSPDDLCARHCFSVWLEP